MNKYCDYKKTMGVPGYMGYAHPIIKVNLLSTIEGLPSFFLKTDFKQPVSETIQSWVSYNECPSESSDTYRIGNTIYVRYGPGLNNTEVVLWTLEDDGHT